MAMLEVALTLLLEGGYTVPRKGIDVPFPEARCCCTWLVGTTEETVADEVAAVVAFALIVEVTVISM